MVYASGQVVGVGDRVLIEHGKTEGVVEQVVESNAALIELGLEPNGEFGVLIKAVPFGLVFWQINEPRDPIIFLKRAY